MVESVSLNIRSSDRYNNFFILSKQLSKDNQPPVIRILVDNVDVTDNDIIYYSDNSKIELLVTDSSGIKEVTYRIDNNEPITYHYPHYPTEVKIPIELPKP